MTYVRRAAVISSAGAVEWGDSGPGSWACSRSSTGVYVVTFPQPFVGLATDIIIMAWPNAAASGSTAFYARFSAGTLGQITISIFSSLGLSDQRFTIEVLGNVA